MSNQDKSSIGSITLIGSGEMSAGMSKTHRVVMSAVPSPLKAVFLNTPAGFQLNVDQISEKAVQYFKKHFNTDISIASFKSSKNTTREEIDNVLRKLKEANYIFAGPGSPTYTVRNWENTEILKALYSRLNSGAHLVFASAASIAIGSYALPVYEIYKVGETPDWMKGLDFF
jgi:cyanophycinase-like exopeptidase